MSEARETGLSRHLTFEEIGHVVAFLRKQLGLKQYALGSNAGVHERTIQRIERGEKVDDTTLRNVTKALGLEENAFTAKLYLPSDEEVRKWLEEVSSRSAITEARDAVSLEDCDALLRTDGYRLDRRLIGDEFAEETASLEDTIRDWEDVYEDISATEQLDARKNLLGQLRELKTKGCQVKYAVYTTEDQFRAAVLVFGSCNDSRVGDIKQLIVPRYFAPASATPTQVNEGNTNGRPSR